MQTVPLVYVGMVGDMLHAGHVNVINHAKSLGQVVVGVLTDEAVADYKRVPFMSYDDRLRVVSSLVGIHAIIPQLTLSYRSNLRQLKPRYVVHGDDWRYGTKVSAARQEVISILAEWGGELVEVPYTKGVSSTLINQALEEDGVLAKQRQGRLRRMLEAKKFIRIVEVHNALSAIASKTAGQNGKAFDAVWQGSFSDSASRGISHAETVDFSKRLTTVSEILDATTFPLIFEGDSTGTPERIFHLARNLDRIHVSGLCFDDKPNELIEPNSNRIALRSSWQRDKFCEKIKAAKDASQLGTMMLIVNPGYPCDGTSEAEALIKANQYVIAGADCILLRCDSGSFAKTTAFSQKFIKSENHIPILVAPTIIGTLTETNLQEAGVKGIVYHNLLAQASYKAMSDVARQILGGERMNNEAHHDAMWH